MKFLAVLKEEQAIKDEKEEMISIVSHGGTLYQICQRAGIGSYNFKNCETKELFI